MRATSLSSRHVEQQSHRLAEQRLSVSVIVPVLGESHRLYSFLEHLRERAGAAEIIIVDGAESPSVSQSVGELCDRIITARRGRATQMNAGAKIASGNVLWFVHADCEVPHGCLDEIARALRDRHFAGGCFRIRFPRRELIYRVSDVGGNLAVELFGRCYGDHGIFCRREDFFAVGGYPDVPLLEDAEFYRKLRRRGRTRQLRSEIITSPRRYEEIGPYRLTASYLLLSSLYLLRFPIPLLAKLYNRLCVIHRE